MKNQKQPLLKRIIQVMENNGGDIPLSKIYDEFKDEKRSTIRGRINEAVAAKKHIIRTGKGQYMLLGAEVEAVIEKNDTKSALFEILKANIYYDLVFLDIPYKSNGQKGGNRNLADYNLIDPEEFNEILQNIEKMLKSEDSQLYFMIAGGKSSEAQVNKYIRAFDETALTKAAEGSYTKLTSQGKVCNMGKFLMPPEKILIYSPNGQLLKPDETVLDFSLKRPPLKRAGGYPTQKPLELYKQIFKQGTHKGGRILDPFIGSGESLLAAIQNGNKFHGIDISNESIENHVKQRLEMLGSYYNTVVQERQKYYQGSLFDYLNETSKELDVSQASNSLKELINSEQSKILSLGT
jgi:hypothetical protein